MATFIEEGNGGNREPLHPHNRFRVESAHARVLCESTMPCDRSSPPPCPPVAVLNPGGRDPFFDFRDGSHFQPGVHPPVNFHAYAACTRGAFCQSTADILDRCPGRFRHVILLLRRHLSPCLQAIRALRTAGLQVWVAWKECGFTQISQQLADPSVWRPYGEILSLSQGVLSPAGSPIPLPPHLDPAPPLFPLPTPYPIDLPSWNYSVALGERSGIFLGTREFLQPSRHHLSALTLALRVARSTGFHVTVINSEQRRGRRLLEAVASGLPSGCLRVIEGRLSYDAYLRSMASHRVVFQLDRSAVPGQVAGDALLCRSLCVGGNSFIEQIAFPEQAPPLLPETSMAGHLASLLTGDELLQKSICASQERAQERLSFAAGARDLARILAPSTL